jgi:hypothetical protein
LVNIYRILNSENQRARLVFRPYEHFTKTHFIGEGEINRQNTDFKLGCYNDEYKSWLPKPTKCTVPSVSPNIDCGLGNDVLLLVHGLKQMYLDVVRKAEWGRWGNCGSCVFFLVSL